MFEASAGTSLGGALTLKNAAGITRRRDVIFHLSSCGSSAAVGVLTIVADLVGELFPRIAAA